MTQRPLPTGTVTFLFTDIEGSTKLVQRLGTAWPQVLERHQALLRAAFTDAGGQEIATEGDSFFVVFPSAPRAVEGAIAGQRALEAEPWPADVGEIRVRMGLHTGEGTLGGDNYVGVDVHRSARIAAAAHGGQIVLSAATAALAEPALPGDVQLRDLGEHHLKDLDRPERIWQVLAEGLPADFPPLRTLEAPTNLPSQVTSFVGREREAADVQRLLKETRLLTLTGPGGTGKTRLSLRVAEAVRSDYPGGTFFVELAPITDPALIPATIAAAVGLREEPNRPVLETLKEYLRERRILLVLDNFEQLVAGAGVVGELLTSAPGLTVLTSSRETLHVRGEHEYPVPPLGLPDVAHLPPIAALSQFDAVALFVQRAVAVRPDFQVTNANAPAVAAICARLDGLPLAIELAAARVKLFAPEAILGRLEKSLSLLTGGARDLPARQQTLRGAIDWSHNLLDYVERTLFRRLAVFQGGCTFETATVICDPEGDLGMDVVDGLASFVDKSLLRQEEGTGGEPRFRMLETIREYARERLAESPDDDVSWRRHGEFFSDLALQAETGLTEESQIVWLDRLEAERDNLRAAMHWEADTGRVERALSMAGALWRFWHQRAHLEEGFDELRSLLGRSDAAAPTAGRAKALGGLGGVTYWRGDFFASAAAYGEALAIYRTLDDRSSLADALYNVGFVEMVQGGLDASAARYDEALAIYESLGDLSGATKVREAFAFQRYLKGDYEAALALQQKNLEIFRSLKQPFRIGNAATLASLFRIYLGDFDGARREVSEAIEMFLAAGDKPTVVNCLLVGALCLVKEGDVERGVEVLGGLDGVRATLGELVTALDILNIPDPAIEARAVLGDAAFDAAFERGRQLSLDEVVAVAFVSPERSAR
jgi:predicted ATPase/class 3 adenylate cyclase